MTRVCYVSQTRVMLRAIALVIFPSFQSGLHPDDGHALQSSLDLRPQVEGPTLTTLARTTTSWNLKTAGHVLHPLRWLATIGRGSVHQTF